VNGIRKQTKQKIQINCRAAAIQQRVTVVLRSIPKDAFADSFQKLYERCQTRVVKVGDYFEGQ
jgi:methylmalonyl-CoA mutase cobalamin-binding subunit